MRRGLRWVLLALLSGVIVEIAVFVLVGRGIGFGWVLLAVLAASVAGLVLLRREGIRAWRGFRMASEAGQPPGERLTDGLVGLLAGILLAVPGLVSGLVGAVLVTPPARRLARGVVRRAAERRISAAAAGGLFGPRRVRVRRGRPTEGGPGSPGPADGAGPGAVVEGEVVEPPPGPAVASGDNPPGRG